MPRFSSGEAIRFGWNIATSNLGFFIVVMLVAALAVGIPNSLQNSMKTSAPFLSFLFGLASFALGQLTSIGLTKISLRLHDGQKPEYGDLFNGTALF